MTNEQQPAAHHPQLARFYDHLIKRDAASIRAMFRGPVAIDTPMSGAVDGRGALETYVEKEGSWLEEHSARIEHLGVIEDERQAAAELIAYLKLDGQVIDLPVALIAQKVPHGFGQVRVYHSMWPLLGKHTYRAPIVWPCGAPNEPQVIRQYFECLDFGDASGMMDTFTEAGYVREPSGNRYKHAGLDGRAVFYRQVTAMPGGVGVTHASATFNGKVCAVEYLCDRWGNMRFAPVAGCAFYELSGDGLKIEAVRIYDDVTPPNE